MQQKFLTFLRDLEIEKEYLCLPVPDGLRLWFSHASKAEPSTPGQ